MNPDGAGGFDRCAKHPSQLFTGFCSSCLAERLCSVDPVERNPNRSSEIVEIGTDSPDKDRNHGEARARKTLLSLFQLDDGNAAESNAGARSDLAKSASVGSSSRSSSAAKGLKWRSGSRRAQVEEGCFNCVIGGGGGGRHLERKHSLRRSCEWKGSADRDDGRDGMEKPRHSWDGSMMGKALTCSFAACLEEPHDGSSRIRRSMPEGTVGPADASLVNWSPREGHLREESRREIDASDVCRKKSQRWSRVWDWSITSPFRDLGKKRQHVLDRSMSESWPESRGAMAEPDNAAHSSANGRVSVRTTALQGPKRSTNGAGNELQKYRPYMQKKREYRFGRSRSVHYLSPRNVDNGLLRFYLTPMRTSRSTNKGRTKTSRFFTKSLLGL